MSNKLHWWKGQSIMFIVQSTPFYMYAHKNIIVKVELPLWWTFEHTWLETNSTSDSSIFLFNPASSTSLESIFADLTLCSRNSSKLYKQFMQAENKQEICAEICIDYSIGCLTGSSHINRIAIRQPMSKRKLNF